MSIELLSSVGNDNTIANVARVSMQEGGNEWDSLPAGYTELQRDRLITYLATHKHTSPFRHTHVSVRCRVPLFLARQLGKHQAGLSWNEVSRRYVATEPEFFYPDEWRSAPQGSIKQGSGDKHPDSSHIQDDYDNFIQLALTQYNGLLDHGVAPEMARMVLPVSMMTEFIWSGNIMAFAHVFNLRADAHAQAEAQDFARELGALIAPLYPVAWESLTGK